MGGFWGEQREGRCVGAGVFSCGLSFKEVIIVTGGFHLLMEKAVCASKLGFGSGVQSVKNGFSV